MPLELVPAASKEEVLLCQTNNYELWGAPLTLEQYQHRDNINYGTSYMAIDREQPEQSNGAVYFVLKDSATGVIESACEILIRDCWVKRAGRLVDARSAVLGSVYTVEKYRNKGNASVMMKELLRQLRETYLTGDCDVAFLYSEVGEYYSRFGYRSFNVPVFVFDITALDDRSTKIGASCAVEYETLYMDYAEVADDYRGRIRKLVERDTDTDTDTDSAAFAFALKPTAGLFEWFANRARAIYWAVQHPDAHAPPAVEHERASASPVDPALTVPTGYLVRHPAADAPGLSYVSFYPEFHTGDCYVTAMHAHDVATAVVLMDLVLKQCAVWKLRKVYAWSTDVGDFDNTGRDPLAAVDRLQHAFATAAGPSASGSSVAFRVQHTNHSLSAIQALHRTSNTDPARPQDPVVTRWEGNGKWCWF